ncbi:MAG: ClpP family protease [Planctomycetota bacterium]|jgi:ATP-dependent Clp protease protease subunit
MRLDCEVKDKDEKADKGLSQELLKTRSILISEPISDELAKKTYAQLMILNERSSKEAIKVYINSPGGDADSGFGIYDMMKYVEAPIITVTCGICASAAVLVFLAADKGKNYTLPNSRFLLHQPSTGVSGSASDIEITAKEIEQTRERYFAIVSEVTGKKVDAITKDADRDFWLSTEEAVKYKLASKIITSINDAK